MPPIKGARADSENLVREGPDNSFLAINVFHRGPYKPPLRMCREGVQLLLKGGPYPISKETYSH